MGVKSGDYDFAIQGMELRNKVWPDQPVDGLIKLGHIHAFQKNDDAKALAYYKAAMAASSEGARDAMQQRIPPAYWSRL